MFKSKAQERRIKFILKEKSNEYLHQFKKKRPEFNNLVNEILNERKS